jgi:hypothetical protein
MGNVMTNDADASDMFLPSSVLTAEAMRIDSVADVGINSTSPHNETAG